MGNSNLTMNDLKMFGAILDTRGSDQFNTCHIHGSINTPKLSTEQQQLVDRENMENCFKGIALGKQLAQENISKTISLLNSTLNPGQSVLVYGEDWGDETAETWAESLRTAGIKAEVLHGGYAAYSNWINTALGEMIPKFEYHVIIGAAGCGKTDLLQALHQEGMQTINAEELISSKKHTSEAGCKEMFISELAWKLSTFSMDKPVWVEYGKDSLLERWVPCMLKSEFMKPKKLCVVSAPMGERIRAWMGKHSADLAEPGKFVDMLCAQNKDLPEEVVSGWHTLAEANDVTGLAKHVMGEHYDRRNNMTLNQMHEGAHELIKLGMAKLETPYFQKAARALAAA